MAFAAKQIPWLLEQMWKDKIRGNTAFRAAQILRPIREELGDAVVQPFLDALLSATQDPVNPKNACSKLVRSWEDS
jgi:hypothetical protein